RGLFDCQGQLAQLVFGQFRGADVDHCRTENLTLGAELRFDMDEWVFGGRVAGDQGNVTGFTVMPDECLVQQLGKYRAGGKRNEIGEMATDQANAIDTQQAS